MKVYENLDQAWKDINKEFLVRPHEIIEYERGAQGFVEDLIFKVKSPTTTIDLNSVAFTAGNKWSHLIRSYIEPQEYREFWENVLSSRGTSLQFRFKHREGPNGPCLIALVLTRPASGVPWTKAKMFWRTAELQRKWAADLVLIHNIFREVPEEAKDMIQIEEITCVLAQAFQSWRQVGPLIYHFCEYDELEKEHSYTQKVITSMEKVYDSDPQPAIKFAPVRRMQKYHLSRKEGTLPEAVMPEDLSIWKALEQVEKNQKGK